MRILFVITFSLGLTVIGRCQDGTYENKSCIDVPDTGSVYDSIQPASLVVPMDTFLRRLGHHLKFTNHTVFGGSKYFISTYLVIGKDGKTIRHKFHVTKKLKSDFDLVSQSLLREVSEWEPAHLTDYPGKKIEFAVEIFIWLDDQNITIYFYGPEDKVLFEKVLPRPLQ